MTSNPGYDGDMVIANTFVDVVNTYALDTVLTPIITVRRRRLERSCFILGPGIFRSLCH